MAPSANCSNRKHGIASAGQERHISQPVSRVIEVLPHSSVGIALKFVALMAIFFGFSPPKAHGQLLVQKVGGSVTIHASQEALIYDAVAKAQVSASELSISSTQWPVGLIMPIRRDDDIQISTKKLFEKVQHASKAKNRKQRQLKLKLTSYVWDLVSLSPNPLAPANPELRSTSHKGGLEKMNFQQTVDWAMDNQLYLTIDTLKDMREASHNGLQFITLLIHPPRSSGQVSQGRQRHLTPTLVIGRGTERPMPLLARLVNEDKPHHKLIVIADAPYELINPSDRPDPTRLRVHFDKEVVSKIAGGFPKTSHAYNRAAYFQLFDVPSLPKNQPRPRLRPQRRAKLIQSQMVASYTPLVISVPVELLMTGVFALGFFWNRGRKQLKFGHSGPIRFK